MGQTEISRRNFLASAGAVAGISSLHPPSLFGAFASPSAQSDKPADYTLTIETKPIELAANRIVSATTYNGQLPGPLLRFKKRSAGHGGCTQRNRHSRTASLTWAGDSIGRRWSGGRRNAIPSSSWETEISFVPKPSGFRFYHTHVRAGTDLNRGQYSGLLGPVYIEPKEDFTVVMAGIVRHRDCQRVSWIHLGDRPRNEDWTIS
jgi:FtsP/CotA-like multicopper oxidase with cupredoxin domain